MLQVKTKAYIEKRLPARLIKALYGYGLRQKYKRKGAHLFVFGSFARSADRQNSDLDLGVTWTGDRSERTFSDLYREIQELPTIRKVDLVDMELVDEKFRNKAMGEAVFLTKEVANE